MVCHEVGAFSSFRKWRCKFGDEICLELIAELKRSGLFGLFDISLALFEMNSPLRIFYHMSELITWLGHEKCRETNMNKYSQQGK